MNRAALLGSRWDCECGRHHEIPLRQVVIAAGALEKTPSVLRALAINTPLFLVADTTTDEIAGRRLTTILTRAGFNVHVHILPSRPCADDVTAEAVTREVAQHTGAVLTCGSGTITDLGKYAAFHHKRPLIAVATAPSMNGYASGIVALTRAGLKTTQAVAPAVAVIADVDILAAAPLDMIRAGLGDLLSKPVANADWRFASLLGGETFCSRPFELIKDLESIYCNRSELLAQRDPTTIAALAEAIVYSGVSMVMAGSSSPASGGEHLISHFLDMLAPLEKRAPDFHGAQVGVGTIATARLYEKLLALDARAVQTTLLASAWDRAQRAYVTCRTLFANTVPTLETEFQRKWGDRTQVEQRTALIVARWDEIRAALRPLLLPAEKFRQVLTAAGAKTRFSSLGVSAATARAALTLAFCIRSRMTVLDLAVTLGVTDAWAEECAS